MKIYRVGREAEEWPADPVNICHISTFKRKVGKWEPNKKLGFDITPADERERGTYIGIQFDPEDIAVLTEGLMKYYKNEMNKQNKIIRTLKSSK